MTDIQTQTQTQSFEMNPPELTFKYIDNGDLMELVVKHTEVTVPQISMICGWFKEDKPFEICMNCNKNGKPVLKFSEEKDFITYLVQQNVLPEGNYLVKIRA